MSTEIMGDLERDRKARGVQIDRIGELESKDATRHRVKWWHARRAQHALAPPEADRWRG